MAIKYGTAARMWSPCCGPKDHDGVWAGIQVGTSEPGGHLNDARRSGVCVTSSSRGVVWIGDELREGVEENALD